MRVTTALDDELVAKAQALTGLAEKIKPDPRSAQGAD
jgi:Arc/MetJ family transcription regulator